jgi:putative tRNA adenosine deaminase-associated protein
VSYFTAVLSQDGRSWASHDIDLDSMGDLVELATGLRAVAVDDQPVLLLLEREDAWWAVVRVDGEEDPRVLVSDVAGAAASSYADVLGVAEVADEEGCSGDLDLLSDLGTSPQALRTICDEELLPMDALAIVAEAAGFAEVLDSLR